MISLNLHIQYIDPVFGVHQNLLFLAHASSQFWISYPRSNFEQKSDAAATKVSQIVGRRRSFITSKSKKLVYVALLFHRFSGQRH